MRLQSLKLENFRSYELAELVFHQQLTTVVGENGVGKSTLGIAIQRLLGQTAGGSGGLSPADFPYGIAKQASLELILELSEQEVHDLLLSNMVPDHFAGPEADTLRDWLLALGREVSILLTHELPPASSPPPLLRWGKLFIRQQRITPLEPQSLGGSVTRTWPDHVNHGPPKVGEVIECRSDVSRPIAIDLTQRLKLVPEFRARVQGGRSGAIESLSGAETASALFNLKNHPVRRERERYARIVQTFQEVMPRYAIEAIDTQPGQAQPEIQFWEEGRHNPVSLENVSAGVYQVLTFLTVLLAREGLVIVLENPEQHLHPHSMRFLRSLIVEASEHSQIVLVTHDPHFVDSGHIDGLRRVCWSAKAGTQVFGPAEGLDERERFQIQTTLRFLQNREMVFARSVILVEDESQQEFLSGVARVLGYDADAAGISIVWVGGENGYRPFQVLLDALKIPYIALRDKEWRDPNRYPPDRFFALGDEIEQFLDSSGIADLRKSVEEEVGTSKRRVAAVLASRLQSEQVPSIFGQILQAAAELAR